MKVNAADMITQHQKDKNAPSARVEEQRNEPDGTKGN